FNEETLKSSRQIRELAADLELASLSRSKTVEQMVPKLTIATGVGFDQAKATAALAITKTRTIDEAREASQAALGAEAGLGRAGVGQEIIRAAAGAMQGGATAENIQRIAERMAVAK